MTEEELLQLIEKAAAEGWEELDLSGEGLTVLPPEIGKLTNLQTLNLSHNKLSSLPAEFGHLHLTKLTLDDNPLESLPPEIRGQNSQAILTFTKQQ